MKNRKHRRRWIDSIWFGTCLHFEQISRILSSFIRCDVTINKTKWKHRFSIEWTYKQTHRSFRFDHKRNNQNKWNQTHIRLNKYQNILSSRNQFPKNKFQIQSNCFLKKKKNNSNRFKLAWSIGLNRNFQLKKLKNQISFDLPVNLNE